MLAVAVDRLQTSGSPEIDSKSGPSCRNGNRITPCFRPKLAGISQKQHSPSEPGDEQNPPVPFTPPPTPLPTLSFSSACVRSLSSSLDCPVSRPRASVGCAVFFSTSNVESWDGGRPHRRPEQRSEQTEKQNNTRTSQAGQLSLSLD